MTGAEGVCILGDVLEGSDIRIGETIRYLQADTEQHREDEENRHVVALEQTEGIKTQCLDKRRLLA